MSDTTTTTGPTADEINDTIAYAMWSVFAVETTSVTPTGPR